MKPTFISGLLPDFLADLNDLGNPGLLWQILAVLLCIAIGSAIARAVRVRLDQQDIQSGVVHGVVRLGVESFSRVLSPLLGLLLLMAVKPILARWHHINILRVCIPLLASFVAIRLAFYVLRRIFARDGKVGAFLSIFIKLFSIVVWVGVALYITGWWPDVLEFLNDTVVPVGTRSISLLTIAQAGMSVATTLIIALWIDRTLEDRLMKIDTMHSSLRAVMARMVRAVLILGAVLVSMSLVGIDPTVLSVFSGALGVGLGLGLQKIASSYVSGFVILLERSLAIGDLVAVDKYYGIVTRINTRYTVLRGMDGIESVVPNDMLMSNSIQNYSLTDSALYLSTGVTVGYKTDLEAILPLLEQAAAGVARVSKTKPPAGTLAKFGATGLELEVGFWISDPQNGRGGVISDVNRAIWKVLQQNNIELPSPQRDIRIMNAADDPKKADITAKSTVKQT
jgi:small-conductance mechanosensitive channel